MTIGTAGTTSTVGVAVASKGAEGLDLSKKYPDIRATAKTIKKTRSKVRRSLINVSLTFQAQGG
jgi:hypothetical protein